MWTYLITREEALSAADHWDALAAEQEARLAWDRDALPSIIRSRATLYRQTATEIRAANA